LVILTSSLIDPTPLPSYPLSLHDALRSILGRRTLIVPPGCPDDDRAAGSHDRADVCRRGTGHGEFDGDVGAAQRIGPDPRLCLRSEEHTSELQSRFDLVCRLLLENT